jgi:16S rRNA (cytidine1402-2'-O)-methyltransferase
VQDTLADLAAIMGERDAAICRELTKMHEDIRRAPLSELARSANSLETRGEFVLVVAPPKAAPAMTADALDDLLRKRLALESVKGAVAHAAALSGRSRREIYARALELARDSTERATDRQTTSNGAHGQD